MLDDYENEDVISYVDELVKDITSKSVDEKRKEVYMSCTKKLLWALISSDYNGNLDNLVTHYATFLRNWSLFDSEFANEYKHLVESLPITSIRLANRRLHTYHRDTLFEYAHKYACDIFKNDKSQDDVMDEKTKAKTETVKSINYQAVITSLNSLLDKNAEKQEKPIKVIIEDFDIFRCTWRAHDPNFAFLYKELLAEYSDKDFELLEKIFKENGNTITLDIDGRKKANKEQDEIIARDEFQEKLNSCAKQDQRDQLVVQTLNILLSQMLKRNTNHQQEELVEDFVYIRSFLHDSMYQSWLSWIPAENCNRLREILEQNNQTLSKESSYKSTSLSSKITGSDMSFEQFLSLIPEETLNYLKYVAPYLMDYLNEALFTLPKKTSFIVEDVRITREVDRYFIILFATMASYCPSYLTCFKQANFHIPEIKRPSHEVDLSMIENILRTYCGKAFHDPLFCSTLLPIDLLDLVFDEFYNSSNYKFLVERLLFHEYLPNNVKGTFKALYNKEHEQFLTLLERKLFEGYSLSLTKYIKNAVMIRQALLDKDVSLASYDITPLSLFLSLYFSRHVREKGNNHATDVAAICSILEENEMSLNDVLASLGIDEETITNRLLMMDLTPVEAKEQKGIDVTEILPVIRSYYYRYYEDAKKSSSIASIFEHLLDSRFVGNLTIDNLLGSYSISKNLFEPLDEVLKKRKEVLEHSQFVRDKHDFYNALQRDTRDLIDYTAKCYSLIQTKMKEGKHNKMILAHEEDALGLAFYLASCHTKNQLGIYFMDFGITQEKVLKLLKLPLTEEEIENANLPFYELSKRFRPIIYEGENKDLNSQDISVLNIIQNFVKTEEVSFEFLKVVFEKLNAKDTIEKDFVKQMTFYIEAKEKQRIRDLDQAFFRDLKVPVQDYLKEACRYYLKHIEDYQDKEPSIAVAGTILEVLVQMKTQEEANALVRYLESKGILLAPSKRETYIKEYDIDVLDQKYTFLLKEGINKGKAKKDITLYSIIENAELILKGNNIAPLYQNLDEKMKVFLKQEEEEQARKEKERKEEIERGMGEALIQSLDPKTKEYLQKVIAIHTYLKGQEGKETLSSEQIREMSLILALYFAENESVHYFEKQQLTLAKMTACFGVDPLTLKMLASDEPDYLLFYRQYGPIFSEDESKKTAKDAPMKTEEVVKTIFKEEKDSWLRDKVEYLGADYDILKYEVTMLKDYELSLDLDARINRLLNTPVAQIDLSNLSTILYFGDSVNNHLKYIQDALPSASEMASSTEALAPINEIREKIYKIEAIEKPRTGLLKYLPKGMVDFFIGKNMVDEKFLNPESLPYLRGVLESDIQVLSDQLKGYDAIRQYIEAHKAKNQELYEVAKEAFKKARKEELAHMHDKAKFDEYLQWKAKREVLESKTKRLKESAALLKQQLVMINQVMASHMITIDGLERSRDDFMPIIGSQIAIQAGLTTQGQSIELTQGVINLMDSLIGRNQDKANETVQLLKAYDLPEDTYDRMEKAVDTFFDRIDELKKPTPLDTLPKAIDVDFIDVEVIDQELAKEGAIVPPTQGEEVPQEPKDNNNSPKIYKK